MPRTANGAMARAPLDALISKRRAAARKCMSGWADQSTNQMFSAPYDQNALRRWVIGSQVEAFAWAAMEAPLKFWSLFGPRTQHTYVLQPSGGCARNDYTGKLMHHALRGPAARGAYVVERVDKTNGAQRPLHLSGRRLASAGHHRNQDRVGAENKSTITRAATANCSAVESDAVADFICARFVLLAPTRASIVRPWVASSFEAANLRSDAAQRSNNAR